MADVIDEDSLLLALQAACPDSGNQTGGDHLASALAQALLNRLLDAPRGREAEAAGASSRRWVPLTPRTPTRPWAARRVAAGTLGAAAVAAGIAGAVTLAGSAPSNGEHDAGRAPTATTGPTGSTLRLAGYSFSLPRGYKASAQRCEARFTPPPGVTSVPVSPPPVVGGNSYAQAASDDGGCVEASLGTGYPANAQPVHFGSYTGFLWRTRGALRGNLLTLYVSLPPSASVRVGMDPGLNLYLDSTGLTEAQLEQIAASGLNN